MIRPSLGQSWPCVPRMQRLSSRSGLISSSRQGALLYTKQMGCGAERQAVGTRLLHTQVGSETLSSTRVSSRQFERSHIQPGFRQRFNKLVQRRANSTAAAAAEEVVPRATWRQLLIRGFTCAVPMVGFGFMDNVVMINVGDYIDTTIGVTFGLSTISAAALGQCCSDVSGVCFGGYVEYLAARLGLPVSDLTPLQMQLKPVRIVTTLGMAIGVLTGCLLGMTSLIFMDTDKAERLKRKKELDTIFKTIMLEGHTLIGAQRSTLYLYDAKAKELWSQYATGLSTILRVPLAGSLAGLAVASGKVVNVPDAYESPMFFSQVDKMSGFKTRSMICAPIMNDEGEVIGVIQMVNKELHDGSIGEFSEEDEKLLVMLCHHTAIFLKHWGGDLSVPADTVCMHPDT